jgi:Protein of unknown function (DUF3435)
MYCDFQLAYCPILHIVSLAFRDNVFRNENLTPDIFWKLRVPERLGDLPINWKEDMLGVPVLRRMRVTPAGVNVDPRWPMILVSGNSALEHTEEDLGFKNALTHYNFRGWVANEVNRDYPVQAPHRTIQTDHGSVEGR